MLKDLDKTIDIFINTHPHNDHLKGIKAIAEVVNIAEVWHSGHTPGKEHKEAYEELKEIMDNLPVEKVRVLKGTRESQSLGDINYNIPAPAGYVSDRFYKNKRTFFTDLVDNFIDKCYHYVKKVRINVKKRTIFTC